MGAPSDPPGPPLARYFASASPVTAKTFPACGPVVGATIAAPAKDCIRPSVARKVRKAAADLVGDPAIPVSYPSADHFVRIAPVTTTTGFPASAACSKSWRPAAVTSASGYPSAPTGPPTVVYCASIAPPTTYAIEPPSRTVIRYGACALSFETTCCTYPRPKRVTASATGT